MASNRTRRTPLHETLYSELRSRIFGGEFRDGDQLPTELELAGQFNVSRGTARHAVTRLVSEGIVTRTAGRGTFVTLRRLTYSARQLLGFTEQMQANGYSPSSEVVNVEIVEASATANIAFHSKSVSKLLSIERIRKADDDPVALEYLLLPWPRFAGLGDVDLEAVSIYDTLEELFGVHLQMGYFSLDIAELSDHQSRMLGDEIGKGVFLMRGIVMDQEAHPIVEVRSYYRPSQFSFHFSVPRGAAGAPAPSEFYPSLWPWPR